MKNSERKEPKKRLVQLLDESKLAKCTVCGTYKIQAIYRFRHQQYTRHEPELLEPVCRKCIYREVYGSKNGVKKMKEGALDGK